MSVHRPETQSLLSELIEVPAYRCSLCGGITRGTIERIGAVCQHGTIHDCGGELRRLGRHEQINVALEEWQREIFPTGRSDLDLD